MRFEWTRSSLIRTAVPAAAFTLSPAASFAGSLPSLSYDEPLDETQWEGYDRRRTIMYDTSSSSFLSAEPQKHLAKALEKRAVDNKVPRVIFAGEEHRHPMHHALQLEIIKAAQALDDAPLCIGLEMCYRKAHQPALDEFVFGDGSFRELRKRTKWSQTWGYDLNYYSKILAFARREKIRLVALNAPYRLISTVAQVGYSGLPQELMQYLPTMDLTNEDHYQRFEANFLRASAAASASSAASGSPHSDEASLSTQPGPEALTNPNPHSSSGGGGGGMTPSKLQRSYEAMTLWDEFMAQSIAGYLQSPLPEPLIRTTTAAGAPPMPPMPPPMPTGGAAATADDNKVSGGGDGSGEGAAGGGAPNSKPPNWRMVVLVGSDHVRGRVGVPDRVTRRTGQPTFTVIPQSVPWAQTGLPAIEKPLGSSEGDWVLYTQEEIDDELARPLRARRVSASALGISRGKVYEM